MVYPLKPASSQIGPERTRSLGAIPHWSGLVQRCAPRKSQKPREWVSHNCREEETLPRGVTDEWKRKLWREHHLIRDVLNSMVPVVVTQILSLDLLVVRDHAMSCGLPACPRCARREPLGERVKRRPRIVLHVVAEEFGLCVSVHERS